MGPGIGVAGLWFIVAHVVVEAGVLVEVVAIVEPSDGLCWGGEPPEGMVLLFTILPCKMVKSECCSVFSQM